MKAAILRAVNDLSVEDCPDPEPTHDQVAIRIKACGVCATDVNMWRGTNTEGQFPFILGHEWVGEIIEVGRNVRGFRVGDRVVGDVTVACRRCRSCREGLPPEACLNKKIYGFSGDAPGCMAEYHATEPGRLHRVPDRVSDDEATLVEPISIGYHGVWAAGGGVRPHELAAVVGAGPIGILTMMTCKSAGAFVIMIEPNLQRREQAKKLGADETVDPTQGDLGEQILELTDGRGATLVLECSGNDAARASTLDVVAYNGRIVLIGISANRKVAMDLDKIIFRGASVVGCDGSGFLFAKPLDLLARGIGNYGRALSHRFPLAKVTEAIELGAGQSDSCKILIKPQSDN